MAEEVDTKLTMSLDQIIGHQQQQQQQYEHQQYEQHHQQPQGIMGGGGGRGGRMMGGRGRGGGRGGGGGGMYQGNGRPGSLLVWIYMLLSLYKNTSTPSFIFALLSSDTPHHMSLLPTFIRLVRIRLIPDRSLLLLL